MNLLVRIYFLCTFSFMFAFAATPLDSIEGIQAPLVDEKGRFCIDLHDNHNHFWDALKIFWATKTNFANYFTQKNQLDQWVTCDKPVARSVNPVITWIGHATFLIQINNVNILTDPIFFDLTLLYPRKSPVGIKPQDLPPIDLVIISHTHRDHLDEQSIAFINKTFAAQFLVPKGSGQWFLDRACKNVAELTWSEKFVYKKDEASACSLYFLPAIHWCNRGPFDINKALWGSWMIEANNLKIYFAGDSAYGEHFGTIGKLFEKIDVALLPIGPNEPRELMKHSHVSAEEAFQAFVDLKAQTFIPMHWGTFRLGTDSFSDPVDRLQRCWNAHKEQSKDKTLKIVKFGERVDVLKCL